MEPTNERMDPNGGPPPEEDMVSPFELFNMFLRHRRLLVMLPVLLAGTLVAGAMTAERTYVASASFLPEASEGRGGGGASLARQFGINIGTERPGQSPQFYSNLLQTREILWQAARSEYVVPGENGARRATLLELYEIEAESDRELRRRAVEWLRSQISVSVSRETGLVTLTVQASSDMVAEQVAERLIDLVGEFNLETRQSQARAEGRFVRERLSEAQAELLEAEGELQAFLRQNRQFRNSPELVFEHERLQRQVAIRQDIISSLAQSHEQARIDAVRDTPVLTIVDHPEGSARGQGRGTAMRAVLGFILGTILALMIIFLLEFIRRARGANRGDFQEFQRLKQEAWRDVRNPWRLVGVRRRGAERAFME